LFASYVHVHSRLNHVRLGFFSIGGFYHLRWKIASSLSKRGPSSRWTNTELSDMLATPRCHFTAVL
jgi:hypothetical protein